MFLTEQLERLGLQIGTIELDGGAVWTLESTMDYDFERDRAHDNGNNGVRNNKEIDGVQYVLFNDGEDYSVAHWYKFTGVDSTAGLISISSGTVNIYPNTRIGNVFAPSTLSPSMSSISFIISRAIVITIAKNPRNIDVVII